MTASVRQKSRLNRERPCRNPCSEVAVERIGVFGSRLDVILEKHHLNKYNKNYDVNYDQIDSISSLVLLTISLVLITTLPTL